MRSNYPNPQEALPLPARPSLSQYARHARELARARRSADPKATLAWAIRWLEELGTPGDAEDVAGFARSHKPSLANARLVIARALGFPSWRRFAAHLEALARTGSEAAAFEAAVNAIVTGDAKTLARLLRIHPQLTRARSMREHHATLLHYVSANGVEGYRQKSPKNAARIAELLLEGGAEVDARTQVYGSGCTTLGLVATSAPPAIAGVQRSVIEVLLAHGARMDLRGGAGGGNSLVRACLANGQPEAAAYLVGRGAPLDLPGAAGLGRVDAMPRVMPAATKRQRADALSLACAYGETRAVEFLLAHGVAADVPIVGHGKRHTGLHVAALYAHVDVVRMLLRHGAAVDAIDATWRTPPLLWALTGWSRRKKGCTSRHPEVVALLVAAGAKVTPELRASVEARKDRKMLAALAGKRRA